MCFVLEVGRNKIHMSDGGRVARAEKALNFLASATGMTQEGRQWLTVAIDPFHDNEVYVSGYPDMASGNSIVQCLKESTTVAAPAGLGVDSTWDCIIRTSNFLTNQPLVSSASVTNVLTGPLGDTNISNGGLEIFSCLTGQNVNNPAATLLTDSSIQIENTLIRRRLRCIGQGFEVHNITPKLYANGSVTTFQQEQSTDRSTWSLKAPIIINGGGAADFAITQNAPSSESAALKLGGSHTWEATKGCYVVPTFQTMENPPVSASATVPMMMTNTTGGNLDDSYPVYSGAPVSTGVIGWSAPVAPITQGFPIPFNTAGAYFTGLSPQSVLKINYNVFIERFPSELDTDLIVLATPSASFDPTALDAYAECMKRMPVGVPVSENGFGDWFVGGVAQIVDGVTGTGFGSAANAALSVGTKYLAGQTVPKNALGKNARYTNYGKRYANLTRKLAGNGRAGRGNTLATRPNPSYAGGRGRNGKKMVHANFIGPLAPNQKRHKKQMMHQDFIGPLRPNQVRRKPPIQGPRRPRKLEVIHRKQVAKRKLANHNRKIKKAFIRVPGVGLMSRRMLDKLPALPATPGMRLSDYGF
jgi:hypothetical protein